MRRRVVGYGAGAVGLLALLASALWWQGEARWGRFEALAPERAFADGTLGLELAPLKYILVASKLSGAALELPDGRPWKERFGFIDRANASARPCVADAPANLPVGFAVSNLLPGNATPVPVKFVGLSCAACHATVIKKGSPPILGAGSQTADVIAFSDAFLSAMLDPGPVNGSGLSADKILATYDEQAKAANCPDETAAWPIGWINRRMEAFFIDQWLAGLRTQARINSTKFDLPFHGADIGKSDNIPTGPARTQPFRSVVRNTLDLPGAANHALSKVPLAALQRDKPWSQFDGSIGDPLLRSMLAVYASGTSIAALAEPEIVHNVRAAADYTLALGRTPPLPTFAEVFPERPKPADERLARGGEVYRQHCDSCHGHPETAGWKMPPARTPGQPDVVNVGTDMARINFRYADMLPVALATFLPKRDIREQQALIGQRLAAAQRAGAFAEADWWLRAGERLDDLSRQYPAGHPLGNFPASDVQKRDGYLNSPIPFVWLRTPYLHNASVLTLRALIGLEERVPTFCRGHGPAYDPEAIGLVTVRPTGQSCPADAPFLFDTAMPGNSNAGHLYPAPSAGVGRDDLEALLDYLRTL
jgi:cytochrome c5